MTPEPRRWPTAAADDVAWLTTEQMVEVDRIMIDELHIELIQMMGNAGRNLAHLVVGLYRPRAVTVYAGSGGNGGGGLVAGRHLANLGVATTVIPSRPASEMTPVPAHQLDIVDRMGIDVDPATAPTSSSVAIDALLGYSLAGAPRGRTAALIEAVGRHDKVVALDVPSGLDAATGQTPGVVVSADATLTLALPKRGLRGHESTGRLFVADISVPPGVYRQMGVAGPIPPFAKESIVEIVDDDVTGSAV